MMYRPRNKYHNKKRDVGKEKIDSGKEAGRYRELQFLERAGEIKNLQRQVRYTLIPHQKDDTGRIIERACEYIADFVYWDVKANKEVVEDVKPSSKAYKKTEAYKYFVVKRKLMLYVHGIRIREV